MVERHFVGEHTFIIHSRARARVQARKGTGGAAEGGGKSGPKLAGVGDEKISHGDPELKKMEEGVDGDGEMMVER